MAVGQRITVRTVDSGSAWPSAAGIETARLILEPLRIDHAAELAPTLDDEALHRYIGGSPATLDELRSRFAAQIVGHSPNGAEGWLNWVVRTRDAGAAVGTVQTTLHGEPGARSAEIAWVIARPHQSKGYASEASGGMLVWLGRHGVRRVNAHIHPEHRASIGVAKRLGLIPTEDIADGEIRWTLPPEPEPTGH
ncbi:MAG: GNAT family N-acetyltransferase [Geodermatophilaceae bacterium]|nr:GNAT family N-acetyltransferase [Geodermatophilaceae bacterium]